MRTQNNDQATDAARPGWFEHPATRVPLLIFFWVAIIGYSWEHGWHLSFLERLVESFEHALGAAVFWSPIALLLGVCFARTRDAWAMAVFAVVAISFWMGLSVLISGPPSQSGPHHLDGCEGLPGIYGC